MLYKPSVVLHYIMCSEIERFQNVLHNALVYLFTDLVWQKNNKKISM